MANEEIKDDNKSTADNKATEVKEPNLPDSNKGQVEPEKKEIEPQDPELQTWIEQTKDLPNAYKRVKGAESEVEKYRSQIEQKEKEQAEFQQQIAQELNALREKDADAFNKLFGQPEAKTQAETPKIPDATDIANQVQAQLEVNRFYENNSQHIKNVDDWEKIQRRAVKFVGDTDDSGKPYTIQTALRDAMLLQYKNLIGDKAVMAHLTSAAKRASASERGDIPSGSAEGDVELSSQEIDMAQSMGVSLEKYKARKRKQKAS